MSRVAFTVFGIEIYWYGILIAAGVLAAIGIAIVFAKKKGYSAEQVYDLSFFAIPLGVVFARLYYVVFEWQRYAGDLSKIFAVRDGGMAIYGAVIGGVLGMFLNSRRKKGIRFFDALDVVAPGIILAQAIGRWGNFFNQEAYGSMVAPEGWRFPLAVYIDALGEWRLATFFYESVWNLIVFGLLLLYAKKERKSGSVFLLYLCGYGFGRMFIEGLRDDSLWLIPGSIRVSQLLSLLLFLAAGALLLILHRKKAAGPSEPAKGDQDAAGIEPSDSAEEMLEDAKEADENAPPENAEPADESQSADAAGEAEKVASENTQEADEAGAPDQEDGAQEK